MLLPQQIQAILYHFMMGWMYGCTFSFLCSLTVYLRFSILKGFMEIIYHIVFTLLLFYGLYQINGGVTNLYLVVMFIMGVCIYYRWYLYVCMQAFSWFIHLFRPIRKTGRHMKKSTKSFMGKAKRKMHRKKKSKKQDDQEEDLDIIKEIL